MPARLVRIARPLLLLLLPLAQLLHAAETKVLHLSGIDGDAPVEWDFRVSSGARAGQWSRLPVPSQWEMHGFGTLSYHSATPHEVGSYRHRFQAPALAPGERAFLVFEGAMTDTSARLNGRSAGPTHQGGFYPFRYEVTALLKPAAENLLEVEVAETSADEGVNKAERTGDYWNFGGIFRPVHLDIVPATFIDHVAVDARADGSLRIVTTVDGSTGRLGLRARVTPLGGGAVQHFDLGAAQPGENRWSGHVNAVQAWSGETPHLYRLEVELVDPEGRPVHRRSERIGFRSFEVRPGDGLYLNGRRIVLLGTNRHSFHPRKGRALGEADHRADLQLIRDMNNNAVRMSHYPPDRRFLELCDELGIYVLNELAGWQKPYGTAVGRRLVEAMVRRDVNHPSVLIWDNGNEGGWNAELDEDFARWDPQRRPVIHPWGIHDGINTAHYKVYPQARALALGHTTSWGYDPLETPLKPATPLIYVPTEILHALYDGGGAAGMEDYFRMMRASPVFGGAFVWAFKDEGVHNLFTGRLDLVGNRAPDGVVGPHGEKEASFFGLRELWAPVVVSGPLPTEGNTVILDIENRYAFTDTSAGSYEWRLLAVSPAGGLMKSTPVAMGGAKLPSVAPGSRGLLHLRLPEGFRNHAWLSLKLRAADGRELWNHTWPLAGASRVQDGNAVRAEVRVEPGPGTLALAVGETRAEFDATTGLLQRLRRGASSSGLANGPRPALGAYRLVSTSTDTVDGLPVLRFFYEGGLRWVEWRLARDGTLHCAYLYRPQPGAAAQGVVFDFPRSEALRKQWLGRGPYREWQNRRVGNEFGLWDNDYNDTVTGWSGYVYPEFKGFFADVRALSLVGPAQILTLRPQRPGVDMLVFQPDLPPRDLQANTALPAFAGDIGLFDAIPAIGTKFNPPAQLGPQSELPVLPPWILGGFSLTLDPR